MEDSSVNKDLGRQEEPLKEEEIRAVFDKHKTSPAYDVFEQVLDNLLHPFSGEPTSIYKKDRNLALLVHRLIDKREFPLVDKNSRLVLTPRAHELIQAALYCLYKNIPLQDIGELIDKSDEFAALYTEEGFGYHWTSMPTPQMTFNKTPIKAAAYVPTSEDKDAWLMIDPKGNY